MAPPLTDIEHPRRPTAAEEARTLAASTNTATLASLSGGDPWASLVTYGLLGGAPVLCVSNLAEHGRNLAADPRASVAIVAPDAPADPLASRAGHPRGRRRATRRTRSTQAARQAHLDAVASARYYIDYSDFSLWILRVRRVRWVGGYGRMDSATADDYAAASPDPIRPAAAGAVTHLNEDHADALLAMTRAFGGFPDATVARCTGADRYGLDLHVDTPRGQAVTRVGYPQPLDGIGELRSATVELTRRARSA